MTKRITAIIILILFLNLIPLTSAIQQPFIKTTDESNILNRTFIRGFILFPRETNNGKTITFFAIRLHYRTITMDGSTTGNIRLRSITIPDKLTGYTGRLYIIGTFHGNLAT